MFEAKADRINVLKNSFLIFLAYHVKATKLHKVFFWWTKNWKEFIEKFFYKSQTSWKLFFSNKGCKGIDNIDSCREHF